MSATGYPVDAYSQTAFEQQNIQRMQQGYAPIPPDWNDVAPMNANAPMPAMPAPAPQPVSSNWLEYALIGGFLWYLYKEMERR